MTYEAQSDARPPYMRSSYMRAPFMLDMRAPVRSTRLSAGSWLGLIVAGLVILAGAIAVSLSPGLTEAQGPMSGQSRLVQVMPTDGAGTERPAAMQIPPSE